MEKRKSGKKAEINLGILAFFPTICLATLNVNTKFEDSGSHRNLTKNLIAEKEKWTNKGNNEAADSFFLQYN